MVAHMGNLVRPPGIDATKRFKNNNPTRQVIKIYRNTSSQEDWTLSVYVPKKIASCNAGIT